MTIRVYHRTNNATADIIDREGFSDAHPRSGYPAGVWVCNAPPYDDNNNDGNRPHDGPVFLIELEGVSRERMFREFEVIEAGKPYREFIVPTDLLNTSKRVRMTSAEANAIRADDIWNDYPPGEPGSSWMRCQIEDDILKADAHPDT